jgi:hypothetical protein
MKQMRTPFDELFTVGMITRVTKLSDTTVRKRIEQLELYPAGLNGKVKYYHHSAIEYIINFEPNFKYLIFESKLNYDN